MMWSSFGNFDVESLRRLRGYCEVDSALKCSRGFNMDMLTWILLEIEPNIRRESTPSRASHRFDVILIKVFCVQEEMLYAHALFERSNSNQCMNYL